MLAQDILNFWFTDIPPAYWWQKDPAFDCLVEQKYSRLLASASRGELYEWRSTAEGRLAEILVLDQFSRNIHRGSALAFANDPVALCLSQEAISAGANRQLNAIQRSFLYMPFMHSESLLIHSKAEELFRENGNDVNYQFELQHKAIIERFKRYPHRNAVLGRVSTEAEMEFLQQPGSSF
ncbi:MAG: DUF924 domain-containing protein [Cellvibrionaceae bacterium]|nr:DUF924 domain-containing protein [Cellvibrionaceae bacterium]